MNKALIVVIALMSGCTLRNSGMTLEPQLYGNGDLVYVFSDLANFVHPDEDSESEKYRLRDMESWVSDSSICPNEYEVIKRQAVAVRTWSQGKKIYYFLKCK